MLVVVDCDCDGFTSAALFINFVGTLYPNYDIDYIMHEGK
jgi:single-stranded DNA-specific DHH superfamily exonuclease